MKILIEKMLIIINNRVGKGKVKLKGKRKRKSKRKVNFTEGE
jgi:hypothetical protein